MKLSRLCLYLGFVLSFNLFAGKIKTITVGPNKMGTIYLSTGRSTVLSLKTPPKKIILGNSNYFNAEFTGIDVTIQPLSNVESNLFIYTDKYRYGVILKPGNPKRYDDLVYLKWKEPRSKQKKKKMKELISTRRRDKRIVLTNVSFNSRSDLYFVDLEVQNFTKRKIRISPTKIWITRNDRMLPLLEKVIKKEVISSGMATRLRLILRLKKKKGFTTHFKIGKSKLKLIVPRRLL